MCRPKTFLPILIPSATVFISSACIMTLELVAGRLIARHLGSSLYTWTSVIGVVLAGITIGNYLGGRIADRFPAKKSLAVLFAISSAACVLTVITNNLVGDWIFIWQLSWPLRVFSHVCLVFLLPSILLGTISPVVAKMALEQGLPTGRTVGDIYAWGAAGSIAGTFLAGFYLIATMGTIAIIWTVGATLLLMSIAYWAKSRALYVWAVVFAALMALGMVPAGWAGSIGSSVALRAKPNPQTIYEDETQYCYVAVKRISDTIDKRTFMQDKLIHSRIIMDDILDLQYSYEQIHAAVTHLLSKDKNKLSVLVIGGGGYVFPRYVEKVWPGSRVDVAEIDPRVTEAAMQAFGLERNTPINTFTMDARNYVDQLLKREQATGQKTRYDFIYEDALNDYSIPYQLCTREFNDKIARILTDNGVYMIELIDIYNSGLFVGAFINTLEKTFPCVYAVTEDEPRSARSTFVLLAAKKKLNLDNLKSEGPVKKLVLWTLNESDIELLRKKPGGIILTDDYAPVENLLAPVACEGGIDLLSEKYISQAKKLRKEGKWKESIAKYEAIIKISPMLSINIYNDIAMVLGEQGMWEQSIEALKHVLEYNDKTELKQSMSNINYNIGAAFNRLGKKDEASKYLLEAIRGYQEDIVKNPDAATTVARLGYANVELGNFTEAAKNFQHALEINPYDMENHLSLARAYAALQRYGDAIAVLKKASGYVTDEQQKDSLTKLQQEFEFAEFKKSKQENK